MNLTTPPPHWPQRSRRAPFPPGDGADTWEMVADRPLGGEWVRYHVRSTGHVWRQDAADYYAPPWWELPNIVRRAVWRVMSG